MAAAESLGSARNIPKPGNPFFFFPLPWFVQWCLTVDLSRRQGEACWYRRVLWGSCAAFIQPLHGPSRILKSVEVLFATLWPHLWWVWLQKFKTSAVCRLVALCLVWPAWLRQGVAATCRDLRSYVLYFRRLTQIEAAHCSREAIANRRAHVALPVMVTFWHKAHQALESARCPACGLRTHNMWLTATKQEKQRLWG